MDRELEILTICLDKVSEANEAVQELNAEDNTSLSKLKNDIDVLLTTISVCMADAEDRE